METYKAALKSKKNISEPVAPAKLYCESFAEKTSKKSEAKSHAVIRRSNIHKSKV